MTEPTALPKELQQRIDTLESFWFAHGGAPYEGITIGEFLTQAHQDTAQAVLTALIEDRRRMVQATLQLIDQPDDEVITAKQVREVLNEALKQLAPSEQREEL